MQNKLEDNLNHWDYIDAYSTWMYDTYSDYVGSKIFDVGAGTGRMVSYYIDKASSVVATDIFDSQIEIMNTKFKQYPYFVAKNIDILKNDLSEFAEKFDTVICINVLEHLENDYLAVEKMKSLLIPSGKLIIMVPAWNKLYCDMDANVNHYRRYDPGMLLDIATQNQMKVKKHIYFNMMGIIPYWLKGRKKRKNGESFGTTLNERNSKIYNIASHILEPLEKKFPPKWGLTELIIIEK